MPFQSQVELTFGADGSPERVSLPGASLNAERVGLAPARFEYATTGVAHYLALHDIVMRDGELRVDRDAPIRQTDLRRKLTFLPAGVPVAGWTDPLPRRNSFVAIHFEEAAIPPPLRGSGSFHDPAVYFRDRGLCDTLTKLDRAMSRDEPMLGLLAESLCDVAIVEFALWRARPHPPARRTPMLPAGKIAQVQEFIAANLNASLSLSDLSRVSGLSKFHFARAFKAAVGCSPYQEVLRVRLAVARQRLADGADMAEVAAQTGFTTAAQLRRSLRQHPDAAHR